MQIMLSLEELLLIAVAALVLTVIVTKVMRLYSVMKHPAEFTFRHIEASEVLRKCCAMFPNELVFFKGLQFRRGMMVRITTRKNKSFEGQLIGRNHNNVICILTEKTVAADVLEHILSIELLHEREQDRDE